jgi:hypothetical protein
MANNTEPMNNNSGVMDSLIRRAAGIDLNLNQSLPVPKSGIGVTGFPIGDAGSGLIEEIKLIDMNHLIRAAYWRK